MACSQKSQCKVLLFLPEWGGPNFLDVSSSSVVLLLSPSSSHFSFQTSFPYCVSEGFSVWTNVWLGGEWWSHLLCKMCLVIHGRGAALRWWVNYGAPTVLSSEALTPRKTHIPKKIAPLWHVRLSVVAPHLVFLDMGFSRQRLGGWECWPPRNQCTWPSFFPKFTMRADGRHPNQLLMAITFLKISPSG